MEENIEKLGQKIKEKIDAIKSMADAESVRVEALGKKGEVIEILKNLKNVEESKRKDPVEKSKIINASDFTFLCLPDAAAIESAALCTNPHTKLLMLLLPTEQILLGPMAFLN